LTLFRHSRVKIDYCGIGSVKPKKRRRPRKIRGKGWRGWRD
jgi:hypothetical protein